MGFVSSDSRRCLLYVWATKGENAFDICRGASAGDFGGEAQAEGSFGFRTDGATGGGADAGEERTGKK